VIEIDTDDISDSDLGYSYNKDAMAPLMKRVILVVSIWIQQIKSILWIFVMKMIAMDLMTCVQLPHV
jgi:hypothetical protein